MAKTMLGPVVGERPEGTYFSKVQDVELVTEGKPVDLRKLVLMYDRITAYREAIAAGDEEAAETALHRLLVAHRDTQAQRGLSREPRIVGGEVRWTKEAEPTEDNEPELTRVEDTEEAEDDASEV